MRLNPFQSTLTVSVSSPSRLGRSRFLFFEDWTGTRGCRSNWRSLLCPDDDDEDPVVIPPPSLIDVVIVVVSSFSIFGRIAADVACTCSLLLLVLLLFTNLKGKE